MQVQQLIALLQQQDPTAIVLLHPEQRSDFAFPIEVADATQGIYDNENKHYFLVDLEEQRGNDTPVVVLSNMENYTIHSKVATVTE